MISVMLRILLVGLVGVTIAVTSVGQCSKNAVEPLQVDGPRLTVVNQSADDWTDVEIWLNHYFRVVVPRITAGGRFQVGFDSFTAGYGQRFDSRGTSVSHLRLTAKGGAGESFELKKDFETLDLTGALRAFGGKR